MILQAEFVGPVGIVVLTIFLDSSQAVAGATRILLSL